MVLNTKLYHSPCPVHVRINNLFTEKPECFEGVNKQKCIIRVPKDCVELYRKAYEWKEFQYIAEL